MDKSKFEKSLTEGMSAEQRKIVEKIRQIKKDVTKTRGVVKGYQEVIYKVGLDLEKRYPNPRDYYLYHILIGSTIGFSECKHFDFPGQDSILKLLEKCG